MECRPAEHRSPRRYRSTDDMSSASILSNNSSDEQHPMPQPKLAAAITSQPVIGDLEKQTGHSQAIPNKRPSRNDKLVPVSDRMPEPSEYNEDPTIRPSQSPNLALNRVIRGMDEEVRQLKEELKAANELYYAHDPSLSRRSRKDVAQKIRHLMAATEAKAQQVYYLYDVLEGQKQAGQLCTEQEIDDQTLQSIGIEPADAAKAAEGQIQSIPSDKPWDAFASAGVLGSHS